MINKARGKTTARNGLKPETGKLISFARGHWVERSELSLDGRQQLSNIQDQPHVDTEANTAALGATCLAPVCCGVWNWLHCVREDEPDKAWPNRSLKLLYTSYFFTLLYTLKLCRHHLQSLSAPGHRCLDRVPNEGL